MLGSQQKIITMLIKQDNVIHNKWGWMEEESINRNKPNNDMLEITKILKQSS